MGVGAEASLPKVYGPGIEGRHFNKVNFTFKRKKKFLKGVLWPICKFSIKLFTDCANIHHNKECRLLDKSKGEDDNLRFERVDMKLSNSLQGKIQWT